MLMMMTIWWERINKKIGKFEYSENGTQMLASAEESLTFFAFAQQQQQQQK